MVLTQYYHTRDPIDNLRVLVTLRKVRGKILIDSIMKFMVNAHRSRAPEATLMVTATLVKATRERLCRWGRLGRIVFGGKSGGQFRAGEARWLSNRFILHRALAEYICVNISPRTKRAKAAKQDLRDQNPRSDNVLMSFTGSNPQIPPHANWVSTTTTLVTAGSGAQPLLAAQKAGVGDPLTASESRNRERMWRRMLREEGTAVREMHMGARIEGTEEVLLMTVRYHANTGLLRSTPAFSTAIGDVECDPDRAVKSPALATYQFMSSNGARYEVAFDNISDLHPLESVEHQQVARELTLRAQRDDAAAVELWQQPSQKLTLARPLATRKTGHDNAKRMMLMCEVVSVKNSRSKDPIGIEYTLVVETNQRRGRGLARWRVVEDSGWSQATPRGKRVGSHSSRPRCTPLCAPRLTLSSGSEGSIAAFASHDTFHLLQVTRERDINDSDAGSDGDGEEEGDESPGRLSLQLGVFSRDSWGRKRREAFGLLQVPTSPGFHDCEVSLWKPVLSIREQLEEQFLGMDETEEYRYPTPRAGRVCSMWGMTCDSTDMTLRVRLNAAVSDSGARSASRLGESSSSVFGGFTGFGTAAAPGSRVVKRSVQEILQSVRLEKRLGGALSSVVDRAMASKEHAVVER